MVRHLTFGLFGIGVTATACAIEEPNLGSTLGESFEQFEARTAREPGTGAYVVDMDHVIYSKQALEQFYAQFETGALSIYTKDGADVRWTAARARNLTYCISDAFGANKARVISAFRDATDNGWEQFADVNFIYVPAQDANCTAQNAAVVFDVNPIADAPYAARAFFPDSPRERRNVLIDSTALNRLDFVGIMGHELGHVLGFRHEHIRPEAANVDQKCIESPDFRALTPYDSASIMHYPQCNGTATRLAFTTLDQQGVALMYGPASENAAPMAQLTVPVDGSVVPSSFAVEAHVVDTDLVKAELWIDGVLGQTLTDPPFVFQVNGLAAGSHQLEIRGTDDTGQTGTQMISVTVSAPIAQGGENSVANDVSGEITGGCSASGSAASGAWATLVGALLLIGRRRRSNQYS